MLTALPLAAAHVQDSVTAQGQPVSAIDSTVVDSPLPGGVAEVVRFLLNGVPSWMQLGGLFLGTVAAVFLLRFLVIRRAAILGWVLSRERPVKAGLVALVVVLVGSAAAMGAATWNYTQHDNDFCTGCHVMNPAFQRYVALGAKHDTLSCHDCHQQSTFASMRQLYLWVAERPERIGPHAKVKNQVCEGCHATADTAKWQRIKTTAGHRVHLESDSSALKDVQCVQCHGVEIHRFRPADATCGQSGCHSKASTHIVLGKM
ncbi:MAG: multiheme c-type cytochrome, partial [Gemmatimonadota bacterium]|nr:multiheme c-type cytochrome [Gemmatimonadota bacterium]